MALAQVVKIIHSWLEHFWISKPGSLPKEEAGQLHGNQEQSKILMC